MSSEFDSQEELDVVNNDSFVFDYGIKRGNDKYKKRDSIYKGDDDSDEEEE